MSHCHQLTELTKYSLNTVTFLLKYRQLNTLYIQKVKSKIGEIKEKKDPTEKNLAQEDFWSNKMNRNNLT